MSEHECHNCGVILVEDAAINYELTGQCPKCGELHPELDAEVHWCQDCGGEFLVTDGDHPAFCDDCAAWGAEPEESDQYWNPDCDGDHEWTDGFCEVCGQERPVWNEDIW